MGAESLAKKEISQSIITFFAFCPLAFCNLFIAISNENYTLIQPTSHKPPKPHREFPEKFGILFRGISLFSEGWFLYKKSSSLL